METWNFTLKIITNNNTFSTHTHMRQIRYRQLDILARQNIMILEFGKNLAQQFLQDASWSDIDAKLSIV